MIRKRSAVKEEMSFWRKDADWNKRCHCSLRSPVKTFREQTGTLTGLAIQTFADRQRHALSS